MEQSSGTVVLKATGGLFSVISYLLSLSDDIQVCFVLFVCALCYFILHRIEAIGGKLPQAPLPNILIHYICTHPSSC